MSQAVRKLILLPRYTTFVGARTYVTPPVHVRDFASADLIAFVGEMIGSTPGIEIQAEESPNLDHWIDNGDPYDTEGETVGSHTFRMDWLRLRITLSGTDPAATLWMVGNFVERAPAAAAASAAAAGA